MHWAALDLGWPCRQLAIRTLGRRSRWPPSGRMRAFSLRLAQPHTRASPAVLIDERTGSPSVAGCLRWPFWRTGSWPPRLRLALSPTPIRTTGRRSRRPPSGQIRSRPRTASANGRSRFARWSMGQSVPTARRPRAFAAVPISRSTSREQPGLAMSACAQRLGFCARFN
jgi:hypothetical protein